MKVVYSKLNVFGINISAPFTVYNDISEVPECIIGKGLQDDVIVVGRTAAIMQGIITEINPNGEQLLVYSSSDISVPEVVIVSTNTNIEYDTMQGIKIESKFDLLKDALKEYYELVILPDMLNNSNTNEKKIKETYNTNWDKNKYSEFGLIVQVVKYFEDNYNLNKIMLALDNEQIQALYSCQKIINDRGE